MSLIPKTSTDNKVKRNYNQSHMHIQVRLTPRPMVYQACDILKWPDDLGNCLFGMGLDTQMWSPVRQFVIILRCPGPQLEPCGSHLP